MVKIFKWIVSVGVIGVSISALWITLDKIYSYFALNAEQYDLHSAPKFLDASLGMCFLLIAAGLSGGVFTWLTRR